VHDRTSYTFGSPVLPRRFWTKIDVAPDGCWLWTGAITGRHYATFTLEGKTEQAHRVAYWAFVGVIPPGLVLDHLCRVRHCVNPAHLEAVTNRENLLRGETFAAVQSRQTHCKRGHAFDEVNTRLDVRGHRSCRACVNVRRAIARQAA
jgi:hypothetical protein